MPTHGSLNVVERKSGPQWYGYWRDSAGIKRQKKLGPAWLQKKEAVANNPFVAKELREKRLYDSWQNFWAKRRDRCPEGFLTHADAIKALEAAIDEREAEIARAHQARDANHANGKPTVTFAMVVDEWVENCKDKVEDGYLKRSSFISYRSMFVTKGATTRRDGVKKTPAIVHELLGSKPIDKVTADDIAKLDEEFRSAGYRTRTRDKYRTVLSTIFKYAIAKKYIDSNPMDQMERRTSRRRRQLIKVYDMDVIEEIAATCDDHPIDDIIRLGVLTGLRLGELIALRVGNLDFDGRVIRTPKTYGGPQVGEDDPKSGVARTVPMSDKARDILEPLIPEGAHPSWLVFNHGDPRKHIHPRCVQRKYNQARDAVIEAKAKEGIELPKLKFHGLRHAFGTMCAAAGVPLTTIQQWMGHADIQTTMVYIHWMPKREDANLLSRIQDG